MNATFFTTTCQIKQELEKSLSISLELALRTHVIP